MLDERRPNWQRRLSQGFWGAWKVYWWVMLVLFGVAVIAMLLGGDSKL